MCWHSKWASLSTLPYTRNYVNHKNRKNSTITIVPNSLSLSSRAVLLSGLLNGSESQNCFSFSPTLLSHEGKLDPFLSASLFLFTLCVITIEKKKKKKPRRDLRLLWGTLLIHFFFSKAFLTGNGFWDFFVYTFCLLGSDSFVLVYCCCSWKSIVTKKVSQKTQTLFGLSYISGFIIVFFFYWYGLWDCFDLTFSLLGFDFFIMIVFMKRALE